MHILLGHKADRSCDTDSDRSSVMVHPLWSANVPDESSWFLARPPNVPSQHVNTCALDVYLMLGRLIHVEMSVVDQLLSEELTDLKAERPLTY